MADRRFETSFKQLPGSDEPGLVLGDDDVVYLIKPDGSRVEVGPGGAFNGGTITGELVVTPDGTTRTGPALTIDTTGGTQTQADFEIDSGYAAADYRQMVRLRNTTSEVFSLDSAGEATFTQRRTDAVFAVITSDGHQVIQAQGDALGFFNHVVGTQPTVTGSKAANAALASLLTALASLGLVIDSTT